jgi:hypothetical protein
MNPAIDDDLEDEAPRPLTRRDGRIVAMPAEPIPAEVNEAFLEDLAFERALSAARDLVSSQTRPSALSAGALQAVWGRNDLSELAAGAGGLPAPI